MNLVNNNFRNPLGNNLGGVAVQALRFVDWLVVSRAVAPHFTEKESVNRVVDAPQRWFARLQKIGAYFEEARPIDPEACKLSIQKDAFYNKNLCLFRIGSSVFAKLENRDRCTVDGDEERVVVVCHEDGQTNSTKPEPDFDVKLDVVGRSNWCDRESIRAQLT